MIMIGGEGGTTRVADTLSVPHQCTAAKVSGSSQEPGFAGVPHQWQPQNQAFFRALYLPCFPLLGYSVYARDGLGLFSFVRATIWVSSVYVLRTYMHPLAP